MISGAPISGAPISSYGVPLSLSGTYSVPTTAAAPVCVLHAEVGNRIFVSNRCCTKN
jgi:hypothetical protein